MLIAMESDFALILDRVFSIQDNLFLYNVTFRNVQPKMTSEAGATTLILCEYAKCNLRYAGWWNT